MNIKITYNWLLEFLDTEATPAEIQKYLSLCGPSVEKVTKVDDDYVMDIEITSNRVDMASVRGIAQEASAILPQFGIKAQLKKPTVSAPNVSGTLLPLEIIDKTNLCKRVLGIVMDRISIAPSQPLIQKRLEMCDVRPLNNAVDITNYVMLEVGHPTHVFDYDRIKTGRLVIRRARQGEKIITLDNKEYKLFDSDIVIDDGTGKVIDFPGIMGTKNSVVTDSTRRIVFFIESNDKTSIRTSSMKHGIRTLAASLNEKGPDPSLAQEAFLRGIELFQKECGAQVVSKIHDLYPHPITPKKIEVQSDQIRQLIGADITDSQMKQILSNLGFGVEVSPKGIFSITVPTFRVLDVDNLADIAEEVARIYGYFNIPSIIAKTDVVTQPTSIEKYFFFENKIKYFLKHAGFNEVYSYSMISKKLLSVFGFDETTHLKLQNPISSDLELLRQSLIPSLAEVIKNNEGKKDILFLFELAKTYLPQKGELPTEKKMLGLAITGDFFDLKGIIEALFKELHIETTSFKKATHSQLSPLQTAHIYVDTKMIGILGLLAQDKALGIGLKKPVYVAEIEIEPLIAQAKIVASYKPLHPYAVIKLDLTFVLVKATFESIKQAFYKSAPHLIDHEIISQYKNNLTLRLYFSDSTRNMTENEALTELKLLKKIVEQ